MRILLLVPGLPLRLDQIKGGVHSAVVNLLQGFIQQDVKVRVLVFSREVNEETVSEFAENISIHYLPEGKYSYHSLNYLMHAPRILKKQIRVFKPDIIHFEEGNSFLFAKINGLYKTAYLQTIHGMSLLEVKRKKKIKEKITWYFNGAMQKVMSPGNLIHLSQFSRTLYGSNRHIHSVIIPNAIVPAYFNLPLKTGTENKIIYLGIIDNNKNLVFLLHRLHELNETGKKFTLDVLGGFSNPEYEAIITETVERFKLGEQLHFHGWVPQQKVLEEMAKADILVVSSMHESLPMVIAEAMAAGKVVAASAVGGIPEMINDSVDGYLFNLNDPLKLTALLGDLYNNHETVIAVAQAAKANATERYQCVNVAKKTISFYKDCIKRQ
ncbi:MAG: glycosyltransferase family 4 protein [Sphingobacteriales bacterium]|nr:glycosyltransferase family 4 protein [Sphingobacteriales bacterium]